MRGRGDAGGLFPAPERDAGSACSHFHSAAFLHSVAEVRDEGLHRWRRNFLLSAVMYRLRCYAICRIKAIPNTSTQGFFLIRRWIRVPAKGKRWNRLSAMGL